MRKTFGGNTTIIGLNHCLNRVVAIWLFFAIIETILIYLLPPWPSPCRAPLLAIGFPGQG